MISSKHITLAIFMAVATQVAAHVIVNEYYRRKYGMI